MQQNAASGPALSDWSVAIRFRSPASQCQLTRILDHHHITSASPCACAPGGMRRHLGNRHGLVAEKACELNLSCA